MSCSRRSAATPAGKSYKELEAALQRLQATNIQTSIRATKRDKRAQFGWLDEWDHGCRS